MSKSTAINDIHKGAIILALFLIGAYATSFAALHHHYADALRHFIFQYMIGSIVLGAFFCFRKSKIWVTLMAIILTCTSFEYISQFNRPSSAEYSFDNIIKVAHYNRRYDMHSHEKLKDWLIAESPDIVVIQEARDEHKLIMDSLKQQYPHQISEPRNNAFGLILASKYPYQSSLVQPVKRYALDNFYIHANVNVQSGKIISVYAMHPPPPTTKLLQKQRNEDLNAVSKAIQKDEEQNIIFMGDWNITPFSPYFNTLQSETGLKNEYTTWLIPPTWPSIFFDYIFQIPIDHILHKGDIHLIDKRRGAHMGSDHYPIIAEFGLE